MSLADPRRGDRRLPASVVCRAAVLCLLSLSALPSESRDIRQSVHRLALQTNATTAGSPTVVSFFRGASGGSGSGGGGALPQASNATGTVWDVAGRVPPSDGGGGVTVDDDGRDRFRTVLMTAGVVCSAVGLALLAAAAFAYLIHARRGKAGVPTVVGPRASESDGLDSGMRW